MVGAPGGKSSARKARPRLVLTMVLVALCLGGAAKAAGELLPAPSGQVFFGVTDTGQIEDFTAFGQSVGKHPAVIETFHPYGNTLHYAIPRWGVAQARPMLHI